MVSARRTSVVLSALVLSLFAALPAIPRASAAACTPVLSMLPGSSTVANGANVSFTLALANTGTGTCNGVYFSLYYPTGLSFVSASPAANAGGYYWNFPSLTAGQTRTIALVAKAQTSQSLPRQVSLDGCLNAGGIDVCDAGTVTITAGGSTPTPTPTATPTPTPTPTATPSPTPTPTPTATATPTPSSSPTSTPTPGTQIDLEIVKDDGRSTIAPGTWNTYTITAFNAGPLDANPAYLVDDLPAHYDPATVTWSCDKCVTKTGAGSASIRTTANMPANSSAVLTVIAMVRSNATGSIENVAYIDPPAGLTDSDPNDSGYKDVTTIVAPTPTPTPTPVPTPTPTPVPLPDGPERGIWFWDRTLPIGQTKINDIIATAELYDFNAIYYTVEDYGTYKAQNNQTKIQQMRDALKTLCSQLHAKGIRCDAVTGEPDFGEQAGFTKALDIADFIIDYNRNVTAAQRVDILQYDVEPHVLSRYENNKASVLGKYVAMIDAVVTRVKDGNANLRVDVVAPHFFDSVQNWTPAITFKGKTQHTFNHVMDSLERLPGGRYHVMAYRRATGGTNGSIPISRQEVETASASYPNTKVIVSQETGNFEPVTVISFYGLCRSALESALVTVQNAFANQSGFGGFSIHSFATYKSLKNC